MGIPTPRQIWEAQADHIRAEFALEAAKKALEDAQRDVDLATVAEQRARNTAENMQAAFEVVYENKRREAAQTDREAASGATKVTRAMRRTIHAMPVGETIAKRDLAEQLGIKVSALDQRIARMIDVGLVVRARWGTLELTPAGVELKTNHLQAVND